MTPTTYFRVSLKAVPRQDEDAISAYCFEAGASGISENLSFTQDSDDYAPKTLETDRHDLDVFFAVAPSESFFEGLKAKFPHIEVQLSEEEQKDWLEEWKKGYEAFPLIESVWVVPSWKENPKEAQDVIRMEPGMAFGTGTHETTQLASKLLNQYMTGHKVTSLLDVGTGTGILALLGAKLGVERVVGVEIDEPARQVARENCQINGHPEIEIPDLQIEQITEPFDLVIANIIDGILVRIQKDLIRCVSSGGALLVTGILEEREAEFLNKFLLPSSMRWSQRVQKGEWVGLLATPKGE